MVSRRSCCRTSVPVVDVVARRFKGLYVVVEEASARARGGAEKRFDLRVRSLSSPMSLRSTLDLSSTCPLSFANVVGVRSRRSSFSSSCQITNTVGDISSRGQSDESLVTPTVLAVGMGGWLGVVAWDDPIGLSEIHTSLPASQPSHTVQSAKETSKGMWW